MGSEWRLIAIDLVTAVECMECSKYVTYIVNMTVTAVPPTSMTLRVQYTFTVSELYSTGPL